MESVRIAHPTQDHKKVERYVDRIYVRQKEKYIKLTVPVTSARYTRPSMKIEQNV